MLNNSISPNLKISNGNGKEQGFTILELIITMVIFLIVTGVIYGLLRVAQQGKLTVNQQVQLTKNVRTALNIIGRDTLNAGYSYPLKNSVSLKDNAISTLIGVPNDVGNADDKIPPIIAGNGRTTNTFATPNTSTDQVTFLFKDPTFNVVGDAGPPDKRVSQALNIQTIDNNGGVNQVTLIDKNTSCSAKDIFVITGSSGASTLSVATEVVDDNNDNIIKFQSNDVLGFNQNGGSSILIGLGATGGSMQRVRLITYFVTPDGVLTRREFGNSSTVTNAQNYVDEPLVYGIEDFQIQYILADGTVSDNPSAGPNGTAGDGDDDQTKLSTIRQIRFTVNAKTIEVSATGQPYKVSMTTTFATRNLGYSSN